MTQERLINRRQQGDLGEASAIEWLTRAGALVLAPLGHSPDYDLIADFGDRLLKVQVKTSVCKAVTLNGYERYKVQLATHGGNQSWSGTVKRLDPTRIDLLFVLTGGGRRWLIPSAEIEAERAITLGGAKYAKFEIEPGAAPELVVYGAPRQALQSTAG